MHRTMFVLAALTLGACDRSQPDADDGAADPATFRPIAADANGTSPDSLVAVAELRDSAGSPAGEARLLLRDTAVVVHVEAAGMTPGLHGVHIHETGACDHRRAFESAGPHLNPTGAAHGLHSASGGHAGDLPNLAVHEDGTGSLRFEAANLSIGTRAREIFDRDGSALVIHALVDDQTTDPAGNSGARVACGVFTRN